MPNQKLIRRIVTILFAIDFFLCFSYGVNFLAGSPFEKVTRLLNLGGEMNIPTWYASMQWFCVALLFGVFAIRNFDWSNRAWAFLLFASMCLLFSIDEIACIHEWLGQKTDALLPSGNRNDTFFRTTGIWIFVVGVPVLFWCLGLVLTMRKYLFRHRHVCRKLMIGTIIFFGGSIGVEILSNITDRNTLGSIVENIFEEGMEMAGVTVLFWAACDLLSAHGFRWHLDGAIEGAASDPLPDHSPAGVQSFGGDSRGRRPVFLYRK